MAFNVACAAEDEANYVSTSNNQVSGDILTAFNEAKEGTTIKLQKDIPSLSTTIMVNKTITIDLNGYTITSIADDAILFETGGNLTITDTSDGENGKIEGGSYDTIDTSNGTLTIVGGTISGNGSYGTIYNDGGTIAITGGEFKGNLIAANFGPMISGGVFEKDPSAPGTYSPNGFVDKTKYAVVDLTDSTYKYGVITISDLAIEADNATKIYDGSGVKLIAVPKEKVIKTKGSAAEDTFNILWKYSWTKDDESVGGIDDTFITGAEVSDSGVYNCVASTGETEITKSINVVISKAAETNTQSAEPKIDNPKTGDNIIGSTVMSVFSFAGLAFIIKKRIFN